MKNLWLTANGTVYDASKLSLDNLTIKTNSNAESGRIVGTNLTFSAKVFDRPSNYGIAAGRVSKLTIYDGQKEIANYQRGWDKKPMSLKAHRAVGEVMQGFPSPGPGVPDGGTLAEKTGPIGAALIASLDKARGTAKAGFNRSESRTRIDR
ncbi:MAG: hypothetical protein AAFN91_10265 [Pseudomonadota bacterium]